MFRTDSLESAVDAISNLGIPQSAFKSLRDDGAAQKFEFNIRSSNANDTPSFLFTIQKENVADGSVDYIVPGYQASILKLPIVHGNYEGINTELLEQQMQKVLWGAFPFYPTEVLENIFDGLQVLGRSRSPEANEVERSLALKYFSNTPLAEMMVLPDITPYLKVIEVPIYNNENDINLEQSMRLLYGKSILVYGNDTSDLAWVKEEDGTLQSYPDFDLSDVLRQMPLSKIPDIVEGSDILTSLSKGIPYQTSLTVNMHIIEGRVEVDPINKTLTFYNRNNKQIHWEQLMKSAQVSKQRNSRKGPRL